MLDRKATEMYKIRKKIIIQVKKKNKKYCCIIDIYGILRVLYVYINRMKQI